MTKQALILGGPGCGKTTALLEIVRQRLQYQQPEEIAYLAFTRKAAYEARTRAVQDLGLETARLIWFRTIHSTAFKALGLEPGNVMSGLDYAELGASLNIDFTNSETDQDFGLHLGASQGEILARLEQLCRVTGEPLEQAAPRLGINIYQARFYKNGLDDFKKQRFVLDFTDMIELFVLEHAYTALKSVKTVIVDEAQDLSPIHWQALQPLFETANEVFIGGDDDQSIFKWAGADVNHFLALKGEKVILPVSHRLPIIIFHKANRIVARIKQRIAKEWKPRQDAGKIQRLNHIESLDFEGDWLLLARHNFQLSEYIRTLRRKGFIYECYGNSSTDTDHVKRAIAWELLRKGQSIKAKKVKDLFKVLKPHLSSSLVTRNVLKAVEDSREMNIHEIQALTGLSWSGEYTAPPWFDALVMSDKESRYYRECLRRLKGTGTLLDKPRIKVSTIHGVKGGEADNVILTPDISKAAFNELERPGTADNEHRVFYVGATRARERLFLLYPRSQRYYSI